MLMILNFTFDSQVLIQLQVFLFCRPLLIQYLIGYTQIDLLPILQKLNIFSLAMFSNREKSSRRLSLFAIVSFLQLSLLVILVLFQIATFHFTNRFLLFAKI